VSADPFQPATGAVLRGSADATPTGRGSFRTRVENTIVPLLPHAQARASEVARRLGLSLANADAAAESRGSDVFQPTRFAAAGSRALLSCRS
jgi:hypothetical protein